MRDTSQHDCGIDKEASAFCLSKQVVCGRDNLFYASSPYQPGEVSARLTTQVSLPVPLTKDVETVGKDSFHNDQVNTTVNLYQQQKMTEILLASYSIFYFLLKSWWEKKWNE